MFADGRVNESRLQVLRAYTEDVCQHVEDSRPIQAYYVEIVRPTLISLAATWLVLTSTGVENQQYQNILPTNVQKLWNNKQMLDITFRADGQEVQAHQLVLAAASNDLCDALSQIRKTTKHAVLDLNRSGITMADLKELLNYLYCGKMQLNPQTCQGVAKAAKTLHIPQVVALCALFKATFMPGTPLADSQIGVTSQTPF
ncbi:gigaxonin-like [Liolophura sinensis]|uniref:gigaxonin-like n=1 Tax=Liolophura sinensis TaxID=3198878 RepID=UPI00315962AB